MHTWKTNGAINWTGDNARQIDCDFSCKGGFKYHNTGKNRGCTACAVNQWTPDDNQSPDCKPCNPIPPNAHYTGPSNSAKCKWECDPGYNQVGNSCRKAVWTKRTEDGCRVHPGEWKDSYRKTYRVCSDGYSDNVSAQICNYWGSKPNDSTLKTNDESCNPPTWVNVGCDSCRPNDCGTIEVKCTEELQDPAGTSHGTRYTKENRYCGQCTSPTPNPGNGGSHGGCPQDLIEGSNNYSCACRGLIWVSTKYEYGHGQQICKPIDGICEIVVQSWAHANMLDSNKGYNKGLKVLGFNGGSIIGTDEKGLKWNWGDTLAPHQAVVYTVRVDPGATSLDPYMSSCTCAGAKKRDPRCSATSQVDSIQIKWDNPPSPPAPAQPECGSSIFECSVGSVRNTQAGGDRFSWVCTNSAGTSKSCSYRCTGDANIAYNGNSSNFDGVTPSCIECTQFGQATYFGGVNDTYCTNYGKRLYCGPGGTYNNNHTQKQCNCYPSNTERLFYGSFYPSVGPIDMSICK
ncbi:MAG: hypothetical protein DLD55_02175 [candidate division SR1 bacterium]|nr:MAG: hypothetical protein DLD55_02175 [candidate division SR1 bacterium]